MKTAFPRIVGVRQIKKLVCLFFCINFIFVVFLWKFVPFLLILSEIYENNQYLKWKHWINQRKQSKFVKMDRVDLWTGKRYKTFSPTSSFNCVCVLIFFNNIFTILFWFLNLLLGFCFYFIICWISVKTLNVFRGNPWIYGKL